MSSIVIPSVRILSKRRVLDMVPYSDQHILRLEKAGKFPRRMKLGELKVGWLESEVLGWIEARAATRGQHAAEKQAVCKVTPFDRPKWMTEV